MAGPAILLGAILTFQASDGQTLQLTVSLAENATCALTWDGMVRGSTVASTRHLFHDLPRPHGRPLEYTLGIGGTAPQHVTLRALSGDPSRLRIALYGDTREGDGPHRLLLQQMENKEIDLVIHTGDFVLHAQDTEGWLKHLASALPLTEKTPVVLALGNHELYGAAEVDGLSRAMERFPPPRDALAKDDRAPRSAFHVRVGPAEIISLDSNQSLAKGSEQYRFLEHALEQRGDAKLVFVVLHHGAASSGPHGPHKDSAALLELFERFHVTASFAGHDHTYERIERNGVVYLISGGGGAPLYTRGRFEEGSQTFASTYNWVLITIDGENADIEAYSAEGALLDRAPLAPKARVEAAPHARPVKPGLVFAALGLLLAAFLYTAVKISRSASG